MLRSCFAFSLVFGAFPLSILPPLAAETIAKTNVVDFRSTAKKSLPAVVFIRVQSKKKMEGDTNPEGLDFFGGNDFWHFFGIIRRGPSSSHPFM